MQVCVSCDSQFHRYFLTVLLYKSTRLCAGQCGCLDDHTDKGNMPGKKQLPSPKTSMAFSLSALSWSSSELFLRAITDCSIDDVRAAALIAVLREPHGSLHVSFLTEMMTNAESYWKQYQRRVPWVIWRD